MSFDISQELKGLDKVDASLAQVAGTAGHAAVQFEQLMAAASGAVAAMRQAAASPLPQAAVGGPVSAQVVQNNQNVIQAGNAGSGNSAGPLARYRKARQDLQDALNSGIEADIIDARIRLEQARRAVERGVRSLSPPDLLSRIGDFLGTARFTLDNGHLHLQPLVNRAFRILSSSAFRPSPLNVNALAGGGAIPAGGAGAGAALPALANTAGGAASAVGGLTSMLGSLGGQLLLVGTAALIVADGAAKAAERIHEFAVAVTESGGSAGDIARLRGFGVDPRQAAGAAAGLRQRLTSDPLAMMANAQLGLGPAMPAWASANQNNARILLTELEALRQVTDAEEQLRLARMLGLEGMLDTIRVSDQVFRNMQATADVTERINDPGAQQDSRDMTASMGNLGDAFGNLMNAVFRPFIPLLTLGAEILGGAFNFLADAINFLFKPATLAADAIKNLGESIIGFLSNPFGDPQKKHDPFGDNNSATDANTRAVRENTQAIREQGFFGGDKRFRVAVPDAQVGQQLRNAIAAGSMRLGAFTP